VTAARGECWVAVRAGSGDGRTLYQNVLAAGHTIRFSAPRLWVRLGDAANVDLRVNGKAVDTLSQDTLEFLASPRGLVG
jgi:hypothetical protein